MTTTEHQEVEIWQCDHCGNIKYQEEEVLCWECGKGEMIFHGKRWVPAVPVECQLDDRCFLRRLIEFPFRLFIRRD